NSSGFFWPSSSLSNGLGSNVSMWLGPPAMNRKMTDSAFAALGGNFAASGFLLAPLPCSCMSEASASEPKPQNASRRKARRAQLKLGEFSHRGTEAQRGGSLAL